MDHLSVDAALERHSTETRVVTSEINDGSNKLR
jgi:hypothetical protein